MKPPPEELFHSTPPTWGGFSLVLRGLIYQYRIDMYSIITSWL